MTHLFVLDRQSGKREEERVFGEKMIRLLYGGAIFGRFLAFLSARLPFVSSFYGWLKKRKSSKKTVLPFIQEYGIDPSEFERPPEKFSSFNDFFIRKLRPETRPIANKPLVCPVDGRYRIFLNLEAKNDFWAKGERFCLGDFLQDKELAAQYEGGSLILARLAPPDYHRFHFPVDGIPNKSRLINGPLYSVNPLALKQNTKILTKNKRRITEIESPIFEKVLMIEVGATNVGSIHETYTPDKRVEKGEEKGYFSFGASLVALLFKPKLLKLEPDLLKALNEGLEIKCKMGQPLGECHADV